MERRLYRSRDDRVLFGVAGGLGEYFDIDSTIVRIIFVVLGIWGGIGVLLYLIGALVIPEEPVAKEVVDVVTADKEKRKTKKAEDAVVEEKPARTQSQEYRGEKRDGYRRNELRGETWAGLIVLLLGLLFLADQFVPNFNFGQLWPLILIVIGLLILMGAFRRNS